MNKQKVVILELEGLHDDDLVEQSIWGVTSTPAPNFEVEFIRAGLSPGGGSGSAELKPISSLPDELCSRVHGLMVFRNYLTREDIARFTSLKVVVRMGVGYDRLDRVALAERGVTVCNVPDYGTSEIADHALALALSLRRGILLHHELQRDEPPAPWAPATGPLVRRIQGATFGCLGLGRIGTAAALRAKVFGWNVVFFDPALPNGVDKSLQIERVKTIEQLFERSTILSVHCPATRHTRGLVSGPLLSLLPQGAILVNTARGEIVNLDAVYDALQSGHLAAAGLDVLEREPVPDPPPKLVQAYRERQDWLKGRLVITPHSAFYSPESYEDIRRNSAQTMREVLLDGLETNVITPDME